jgi:uncharacterized protein (DUF342 family)
MDYSHYYTNSQQPTDVRIVSRAFDSWNVEFKIDVTVLLDQTALVAYLRSVKKLIAETQSIPQNCLMFDGIVRKTRTDQNVDVVVRIKRKNIEKGNPFVKLECETSTDGTEYANMRALLNLSYFDDFDCVITHDRIMQCVREAHIKRELVDTKSVLNVLEQVLQTQSPQKGILIAQGKVPDCGSNAEVEFYIQTFVKPANVDQYYSTRRVQSGDLLCHKLPATSGCFSGENVLGEFIEPRCGLDVKLLAGPNTELSLDALDLVASCDGVAVVNRESAGRNNVAGVAVLPKSIKVQVNPILKIKGNEAINMETNSAVEIEGNLCCGSRILTVSEVFISGDVELGSSIVASDDVFIVGSVRGANISSDRNIISCKDVDDSTINAQDNVVIKGSVRNSSVTGDTVVAQSISGSRVLANRQVTLDRIDADEGNVLSTICVGMHDFFGKRLEENQKFIQTARDNLGRIEMVLGEDVIQQALTTTTQAALMKLLSKLRSSGGGQSKKQVAVYRQLIDAVAPTKAMILQKEQECMEIVQKMSENNEQEGLIIVKERVSAKVVVEVEGNKRDLLQTENGVTISGRDGQLTVNQHSDLQS